MQYHLLNFLAKINPSDVGVQKVDANAVVDGVLKTAYYLGGAVCVIVIIIAGIFYALSNGDQAKVTQAKNAILYAIVGLVIVMLAFVINNFVIGRF